MTWLRSARRSRMPEAGGGAGRAGAIGPLCWGPLWWGPLWWGPQVAVPAAGPGRGDRAGHVVVAGQHLGHRRQRRPAVGRHRGNRRPGGGCGQRRRRGGPAVTGCGHPGQRAQARQRLELGLRVRRRRQPVHRGRRATVPAAHHLAAVDVHLVRGGQAEFPAQCGGQGFLGDPGMVDVDPEVPAAQRAAVGQADLEVELGPVLVRRLLRHVPAPSTPVRCPGRVRRPGRPGPGPAWQGHGTGSGYAVQY